MDSKTFSTRLAAATGESAQNINALLDGFSDILRVQAGDLNSILIPGFGNFVAMKKPEKVVTDPATGRRQMVPPLISVEFVPSAMLKYRISNE